MVCLPLSQRTKESPLSRRRVRRIRSREDCNDDDPSVQKKMEIDKKNLDYDGVKKPLSSNEFLITLSNCRPERSHARKNCFSKSFNGLTFQDTTLTATSEKTRLESTIDKRKAKLRKKREEQMKDFHSRMIKEILLLKQKQTLVTKKALRRKRRQEARERAIKTESAIIIQAVFRGRRVRIEQQGYQQYHSLRSKGRSGLLVCGRNGGETFITGMVQLEPRANTPNPEESVKFAEALQRPQKGYKNGQLEKTVCSKLDDKRTRSCIRIQACYRGKRVRSMIFQKSLEKLQSSTQFTTFVEEKSTSSIPEMNIPRVKDVINNQQISLAYRTVDDKDTTISNPEVKPSDLSEEDENEYSSDEDFE